MKVNTTYDGYDAEMEKIKRVRDFAAGEDVVKAAGDKYLPRLGKAQREDAYQSFKSRGFVVPAVTPTATAVAGSIMRKPATVDLGGLKYLETNTDGKNTNITQFAHNMITELLFAGAIGYLVEFTDKAYIKQYSRENVINYDHDFVVLAQTYKVRDPKDKFKSKTEIEYLELTFDKAGFYIQNIWRNDKGWKIVKTLEPTIKGKRMTEIPFLYVRPNALGFGKSDPLLLHLATANLDQYRMSTDLRHGLHMAALPTFVVCADNMEDEDGKKVSITVGPGTSNHIPDKDAKVQWLEVTGAGLKDLSSEIALVISLMAGIGAKMLTGDSKGVKAAETARIEASSETATLTTLADTVDLGVNRLLEIVAFWMGTSVPLYRVNRDFIDVNLDPASLLALLKTWQSGGMSQDSFLYQLKKGELLPPDVSPEQEADRIESGKDFEVEVDLDEE